MVQASETPRSDPGRRRDRADPAESTTPMTWSAFGKETLNADRALAAAESSLPSCRRHVRSRRRGDPAARGKRHEFHACTGFPAEPAAVSPGVRADRAAPAGWRRAGVLP